MPMVIGNTIAYMDSAHISDTYAKQLAIPLAAALTTATRPP